LQESLKNKATKSMFWNAFEKFSVQGSQFLFGVLLARLLVPADFGLVGMLAIFIALAQIFVDSGMGSGLIQLKQRTKHDFSTVFIFNFAVSTFVYLILFFSAPYIAKFYATPALLNITRVIGLNIIINSLSIVQRSRLKIRLDFKTLAKVNIASVLISGVCSVFLAYSGLGVWSLVYRQVIYSVISVVLLWYFNRWKPSFTFSKESFKNLFGYGSKILAAGIYAQVFQDIYNIVIGKVYSAGSLGYFTQAKQLTALTAGTVTNILQQVTFPILASLQEDKERMISVYRRLIRMTAFFIFPVMTILALMAEPFIELFLGEKWLPTVPLLQWMCFARILYPISTLNMNILKANGRSDVFLKVDLSKAPIMIIALIITIPISVKAMVIGQVVTTLISFFINAYMPGKLFGYGILSQLKDLLPMIYATIAAAFFSYLSTMVTDMLILKLTLGVLSGLGSYLFMSSILKIDELKEVKILLAKIHR